MGMRSKRDGSDSGSDSWPGALSAWLLFLPFWAVGSAWNWVKGLLKR